jgi:hypothetical protein
MSVQLSQLNVLLLRVNVAFSGYIWLLSLAGTHNTNSSKILNFLATSFYCFWGASFKLPFLPIVDPNKNKILTCLDV